MLDYEIELDLDGVLANFNKKANEVLGTSFQGADNDWAWDTLLEKCPSMYRELELLEDAPLLLEFLRPYTQVFNLSILTAIPRKVNFPTARFDKVYWVDQNLPYYIPVKFGPYSIDKQKHCKGKNHILIDDNHLNILQWNAKGGIGILHFTAESTIQSLQALGFK